MVDTATLEIAFGFGPLDNPSGTDWVDFTNLMREATTGQLGKQHELNRSQAGTSTIRMDNRSRIFDPSFITGPYFGQLVPGTPIRFSLNGNILWTHLITNYNQTWPSGPMQAAKGDAEVDFGCIDAFDLLSNYELTSYPDTVIADAPSGYWRMNEAFGATAVINYGAWNDAGVTGVSMNLGVDTTQIIEIQLVKAGSASGGTWQIGWQGNYSGALAWNISETDFETALKGIGLARPYGRFGIIKLTVTVTGTSLNGGFSIEFKGQYGPMAGGDQPMLAVVYSSLVGDTIDVTEVVKGGVGGSPATLGFSPGPLASNQTVVDFSGTDNVLPLVNSLIRSAGPIWNAESFEFWIKCDSLTVGDGIAALYEYTAFQSPSATAWRLSVDTGGAIKIEVSTGFVLRTVATSPTGFLSTSGGWAHIAIVSDSGLIHWIKNGVEVGFTSDTGMYRDGETFLNLARLVIGAISDVGSGFDGQLAHFAVYDNINNIPLARIATHFLSTTEEFDSADAGTVVSALLDAVGWPQVRRSIDEGSSLIQAFTPSGSVLDLMLTIAEDSELGLLQIDRDGNVIFISRHNMILNNAVPVATFGDAGSEVHYSYLQIDNDGNTNFYNIVKATSVDGIEQVAFDPTTQAQGPRVFSKSGLLLISDEETRNYAGTILAKYKTVRERPRQIVLLSRHGPNELAQVESLTTLGDHILVKRRPPGGGDTKELDAQVEGVQYHFSVNGRLMTATYDLIPANAGVWVLHESAIGVDTAMGW